MQQEIVLGLAYTDDGIKITTDKIFSFHTHTHMYNELLLYDAFEGHITINGENIFVTEPTVLLVTPSDFHSTNMKKSSGEEYVKIAFADGIADAYITPKLTHPIVCFGEDPLLHGLIRHCAEGELDVNAKRIFLNMILLELIKKGSYLGTNVKRSTEVIVLNAVRKINESFFEDITLKQTAKDIGVTPQYLSNVFFKHIGIGFSEYLRNKRLIYAAALLSEGEKSVTEVCFACGYSNLSHFLRSFKKKYGITPKEFFMRNS